MVRARIFLSGIFLLIQPLSLRAETFVALVIGNQEYAGALRLDNPGNDATDVAEALQKLGFQTTLLIDADRDSIKKATTTFSRALQQDDAKVGVFFYAGHGVQVDGKNYLIPLNAAFRSKADIVTNAVDASWVLDMMQAAKNKTSILILDACRDYPFADGSQLDKQGFAQMSGKAGALIAYSTAPGNIAQDGEGRNSPYTKYLKITIKEHGLEIEDVFKKVRKGVREETHETQLPWELSALTSH